MGQTEQFGLTVRLNQTFGRSLCHRYPHIFISFFVLKHTYYFGFASLGLAFWLWRLQWAAVMMEERGKKWDFFVHFLIFFILADIREIILTWIHFWQCTARFTSRENQLTSGQKQLTSGHRRVVEEQISSHFSFSLFLFSLKLFYFLLELTSLHFTFDFFSEFCPSSNLDSTWSSNNLMDFWLLFYSFCFFLLWAFLGISIIPRDNFSF